jgi:hypothetical protein
VYAAPPAAAPAATPTRTTSVGPSPSATLAAGGAVSLESANRPGRFVAVDADAGVLAAAGPRSDAATRVRVTFRVVDGLADADCLSFRAPDGRHLRHSSWRVRLQPDDGTALYRGDATFCPRPAEEPGTLALESANYPGWFLRHVGGDLWVDRSDGSAGFRADSAFRVRPPLAG